MSDDTTEIDVLPRLCAYPGCDRPAEQAAGPGRPSKYCTHKEHNPQTAFRAKTGQVMSNDGLDAPDLGRPVSMARARAEITREKIAEQMKQLTTLLHDLAAAGAIATDQDAVEAQIDAVTTEAQQRISAAEAARACEHTRRLSAEESAAQAQEAAQEMAAQIDALTTQLHDTETERDATRSELAELTSKLERTSSERDDLATQLAAASSERDAIRNDLDQYQRQLENTRRDAQNAADHAQQRLTDAHRERDQALAAADRATEQITTLLTHLRGSDIGQHRPTTEEPSRRPGPPEPA